MDNAELPSDDEEFHAEIGLQEDGDWTPAPPPDSDLSTSGERTIDLRRR